MPQVPVPMAATHGCHGIIMVQKPYDGDGFYYDLQGRRIQTVPQHPGIYISNGAKVIVR